MDLPARFTGIYDALSASSPLSSRAECERYVKVVWREDFNVGPLCFPPVLTCNANKRQPSVYPSASERCLQYHCERGLWEYPESLALLDVIVGFQKAWLETRSVPLQWNEYNLWPGLGKDGCVGEVCAFFSEPPRSTLPLALYWST